jgi:hypothetical protein
VLAVGDVGARRARLLHRVHILLRREKQNAIVRARFQALIDGLRKFSNDNHGVQVFGFDAVQGTTAADRSPHCVRPRTAPPSGPEYSREVADKYAVYLSALEKLSPTDTSLSLQGARSDWIKIDVPAIFTALRAIGIADKSIQAYALATAAWETQEGRLMKEMVPRQSAPNSSRVALTFPLSMSLLAQSGIEQMREPDACFLQLLPDDRCVHGNIGRVDLHFP